MLRELNEIHSSLEAFIRGVCAQKKLPNFQKLWDDFIQEETKPDTISDRMEEIQDLALIGKMKVVKKEHQEASKGEEQRWRVFEPGEGFIHVKCFNFQVPSYGPLCF